MKVTLIFVILFFISSIYCQCAPEDLIDCDGDLVPEFCPSTFINALIGLYTVTDGDNWKDNTNWDLLSTSTDACQIELFGLSCFGSCPSAISLGSNNLNGNIGGFTATDLYPVEKIYLEDNNLNGDLTQLFTLSLRTVQLSHNSFYGALPPLPSTIEYFDMNTNSLLGPLPDFIDLPNLGYIILSNNFIAGAIDDTNFVNLPSLSYILLDHNQFTGSLPAGIFAADQVFALGAFHDNFFDSFPSDIQASFDVLDVSRNSLSGDLPYVIVNFFLDVSQNSLGPTFSDSYITLASSGGYFNISHNSFKSPLPPSFRIAPTTPNDFVDLTFNLFDCPLPDWCSSEFGNGLCEPCATCYNIVPGTLQHNLTLCDPYKNHLTQNPPEPVRISNSTDFEYVTTLYGGSFTTFYNLVPDVYYTFSACEAPLRDINGFDSVFVLRDPKGNILGTNNQCSQCGNGHSELTYLHPADATYSTVTLSAFLAIQNSKSFSCTQSIDRKLSMPLYQRIEYVEALPACVEDYTCDVIPSITLTLDPFGNNPAFLSPGQVDENSYYCGFNPKVNQTSFDCSDRGKNIVKYSFYDYSCTTEVIIDEYPPTYSCDDTYIVAQFNPLCTPHGCRLNIYDFDISIFELVACSVPSTKPEEPIYAYIGDKVDYHLYYHDDYSGTTEVVCPINFYGLRIIDILDETEIDTNNVIFDISIDFDLPFFGGAYTFAPFIISVEDYDPKSQTLPSAIDSISLSFERSSARAGGITLHNIDFSGIVDGDYYLMAYAEYTGNTVKYLSIGNPIVYFFTSPSE